MSSPNSLEVKADTSLYILDPVSELNVKPEFTEKAYNVLFVNNNTNHITLNFPLGQLNVNSGSMTAVRIRNGMIDNGECHSLRRHEFKFDNEKAKNSLLAKLNNCRVTMIQGTMTGNLLFVQSSNAKSSIQMVEFKTNLDSTIYANIKETNDEDYLMCARNGKLYVLAENILTEYVINMKSPKPEGMLVVGRSIDIKKWIDAVKKSDVRPEGIKQLFISLKVNDKFIFISSYCGTVLLPIATMDEADIKYSGADTDIISRSNGYIAYNRTLTTAKSSIHVNGRAADPAKPQFEVPKGALSFPDSITVSKENHNSTNERVYIVYTDANDKQKTAVYYRDLHNSDAFILEEVLNSKVLMVAPDGKLIMQEETSKPKSIYGMNETGTLTFTYSHDVVEAIKSGDHDVMAKEIPFQLFN